MSDLNSVGLHAEIAAGIIDDGEANKVKADVAKMKEDISDLEVKALPTNDGETGMEFLARVDVYDLLTDEAGYLLVDNEGEPLFGAVNANTDEAKAALKAANAAQVSADEAGMLARTANSKAEDAQSLAAAAAPKTDPVFTGSFSQNRMTGTTIGTRSHTEGYNCTASGTNAHAEGSASTAFGTGSHAEGYSCKATGTYSHAEGQNCTTIGYACHAEGCNTQAKYKSVHVQGEYNADDTDASTSADSRGKYVHIVGNGTSTARSNAHTLDWSGNAWYAGTVEGTAMIVKSSTANSTKRFKITVDDNGLISATEITA